MVNVSEIVGCYGCTACIKVCPKSCIHKKDDAEGFIYPKVNESQCIKCKKCLNVCPREKQNLNRMQAVYGMKNLHASKRETATSGVFFSAVAELIIEQGRDRFCRCVR